MKKLLYLICLLSFGQIFSADNGQPPAKRQRVSQHKQSFDFSKWRMHDDNTVESCKTCGKIFPDPNDEEAIEGHGRFCNPNKKPRARRKKYSLTNTDLSSNLPLSDGEKELATALLMLGSDLGKRPAPGHTDGEPPAKRQKVAHAGSAESISKSEDSESSQGEDEEFLCQYCGQDLNSQRALDSHEQSCSQRPDLLNTQQEFKRWQNLSAQQQQLQQQQLQQQWQLQQRLQQQLFAQQQQQLQQQQLFAQQQQQLQQQQLFAQQQQQLQQQQLFAPVFTQAQVQDLFTEAERLQDQQSGRALAVSVAAPAQANPLEAGVDNSNSEEILCRLCEKSIPTYKNFKEHQLEKHYGYKEPDNEIKCRIKNCLMCKNNNRGNPTTFHNNGNRKRHEEVAAACKMPYQRNIGKYNCAHCNKKFTRNHDLQTHIATTCDKVPENLRKEINRSKFTCPHCCSSNPFKFFVLNDLNEHIKDKHTGKELVQIDITAEQQPQAAVSSDDDDEDDDSDQNEV